MEEVVAQKKDGKELRPSRTVRLPIPLRRTESFISSAAAGRQSEDVIARRQSFVSLFAQMRWIDSIPVLVWKTHRQTMSSPPSRQLLLASSTRPSRIRDECGARSSRVGTRRVQRRPAPISHPPCRSRASAEPCGPHPTRWGGSDARIIPDAARGAARRRASLGRCGCLPACLRVAAPPVERAC